MQPSHVRIMEKQVFEDFKKYCLDRGLKMGFVMTKIVKQFLVDNK